MTRSEVALLLAKIASYDQRTIGDADVLAWHEVLYDIDAARALAAVSTWQRELHHDRMKPADVIAEMKMRHAVVPVTVEGEGERCTRASCKCDHLSCDRGFITTRWMVKEDEVEGVRICPKCRA